MSTVPVGNKGAARIVVGVHGSDSSTRALRWAAQEARLRSARLEVIHAWQIPSLGLPGVSPPYPDEMFEPAARAVVDHAVADLEAGPEEAGIDRRAAKGHPSAVLIEASEGAALIVVGSHGHGSFAGTLLGSVSQRVAHHARCPVVIVPTPQ
ncbi:universal stress protein [Streptomyces sp. ADMS]|uniref:universal stress protein n=1 Tax=Streptomyces sp. ADMS TaxID=3071415 RepID=UPI00296F8017|nr:universal stress protein [Streptomyces sp. ADMS]MDW4907827.1 universal stress protein [Streptomyces sp. ADMS]